MTWLPLYIHAATLKLNTRKLHHIAVTTARWLERRKTASDTNILIKLTGTSEVARYTYAYEIQDQVTEVYGCPKHRR